MNQWLLTAMGSSVSVAPMAAALLVMLFASYQPPVVVISRKANSTCHLQQGSRKHMPWASIARQHTGAMCVFACMALYGESRCKYGSANDRLVATVTQFLHHICRYMASMMSANASMATQMRGVTAQKSLTSSRCRYAGS